MIVATSIAVFASYFVAVSVALLYLRAIPSSDRNRVNLIWRSKIPRPAISIWLWMGAGAAEGFFCVVFGDVWACVAWWMSGIPLKAIKTEPLFGYLALPEYIAVLA